MNSKATKLWGQLSSKVNDTKNASVSKAKIIAKSAKESAERFIDHDHVIKCLELVGQSATATSGYLKEGPEILKEFGGNTIERTGHAVSKKNLEKYKGILTKATEDTWTHVREAPEAAIEKYNNMDKGYKILALSAMAGGAVVSIPFIMAMGPMSIVTALSTLGLGALSAGGYGIAGGIIVTAGGAALTASIAGTVAHKLIDDPEVNELISSYGQLEGIIKQNFQTMENNQDKFRGLYEKYAQIAEFIIELQETIESGDDYNLEVVRDQNNRIKYIIEDLTDSLK